MEKGLQLIVEGKGDGEAIPLLVRRILNEKYGFFDFDLPTPHERGDWPAVRKNFGRYFQTAIKSGHPVLCVLDFDCEGCTDLESTIQEATELAQQVRPGWLFAMCFMVREYESLFLWDESASRQVLNIKRDYVFPHSRGLDPESIRNAKGELGKAQPNGHSYKEAVHQAKLTAQVDLGRLSACSPSYQRLEQSLIALLKINRSTV